MEAFKCCSLGFIRCLGLAFQSTMIDSEQEWRWLRDMSTGIKRRLQTLGIYEYEEAQTCRKCLQASLTLTEYSLYDLVVFACSVDKTRWIYIYALAAAAGRRRTHDAKQDSRESSVLRFCKKFGAPDADQK